jgi:hypothetical protein
MSQYDWFVRFSLRLVHDANVAARESSYHRLRQSRMSLCREKNHAWSASLTPNQRLRFHPRKTHKLSALNSSQVLSSYVEVDLPSKLRHLDTLALSVQFILVKLISRYYLVSGIHYFAYL